MKKKWLIYLAPVLFLIIGLSVDFNRAKWKATQVLHYDILGYHHYLPATIIYDDIYEYQYLAAIDSVYGPLNGTPPYFGLHPVPHSQNLCNQYPVGVSLFQAPFFLLAHGITMASGSYPADGYSTPYQLAVAMSTLIYGFFGLLILAYFLRRYFHWITVFFTVALIGIGTNFLCYSTIDSGMSHIYLFFIYASVLNLTDSWYKQPAYWKSILLGICIGWAGITRPLDFLICLIPILWVVPSVNKPQLWRANWQMLAVSILMVFLMTLPQISYWKLVTGDWIYYSYGEYDKFVFNRFRWIHGLFSYRKGWFVYTPIALVAVLGYFLIKRQSKMSFYLLPSLVFLVVMTYFIFSWNNWFYGWGFGCRALIQSLAIISVPLAVMLEWLWKRRIIIRVFVGLMIVGMVYMNLFQTRQYRIGHLHGTLMNEASYWSVFLKNDLPPYVPEIWKLQEEIDHISGW